MYNNAVPALIDAISAIRSRSSEDCVYEQLRAAVGIAAQLPAVIPDWLSEAEIEYYEDTDKMLANLQKVIDVVYNKSNPVCVMSPDLFLARTGHEKAGRHYQSAIYTAPRGIRADAAALNNLTVIFIQVEREMPRELSISASAVILLCPKRFNSTQLEWIGKYIRDGSKIMLLETDKTDDLASVVRENDKRALEFMAARWELEKDKAARDSQIADILSHLEAMAREVEYGTGA